MHASLSFWDPIICTPILSHWKYLWSMRANVSYGRSSLTLLLQLKNSQNNGIEITFELAGLP